MNWIYLLTVLASAAVADAPPLQDADIFRKALSRDVFTERHCKGMSAERTKHLYNQKYKPRQDRIRAAIVVMYGPDYLNDQDIIAIGFPCSRYNGAEKHLKRFLLIAEKRLRIPPQ